MGAESVPSHRCPALLMSWDVHLWCPHLLICEEPDICGWWKRVSDVHCWGGAWIKRRQLMSFSFSVLWARWDKAVTYVAFFWKCLIWAVVQVSFQECQPSSFPDLSPPWVHGGMRTSENGSWAAGSTKQPPGFPMVMAIHCCFISWPLEAYFIDIKVIY